MMERRLTTNSLFHDDEEAKKEREQIYVPLALVERKKTDKRKEEEEYSPDRGSELYEPEYEEKQRFQHSAFLQQILQQGQGKTQGRRIALIGEPGAGKTTLLQKIADWIEEQKLGLPLWVPLADLAPGGSLQDFDSYLLKRWLPRAVSEDRVERDFKQQFERQQVWLLLDGVDEVATSGVETLGSIAKQLVGWVGKARVVLTCRLNVWQADANALSNFETFRLLDFDYPQQVHRFIDNWFADKDKRKRLQEELAKAEKSRIQDLVKNPLRLALLCYTWLLNEGDLPETQAGLYAQFVDRFYHWKSNLKHFEIRKQKQRDLNQALGELALADIDSRRGRFRLREDFVCEKLGDADDESSLCYVALQLGWLNQVGVVAESPDEKVYAFYHATFEEYFAALAVSDWHFFLNHLPENVADGNYRVFKSQWKQVILLWLGRKDVDDVRKEEFISALVDFDDNTGRDFYGFRTLFLAAAGIAEFKECSRADEIVGQVGFVFFSDVQQKLLGWYNEIERAARVALGETAVAALVELIRTSCGRAVAALVELIRTSQCDYTRGQAADSLGEIGQGKDIAIAALVELIRTSQCDYTRGQAADSLGEIGQGKDTAIAALVELIRTSQSDYIRRRAADSLGKIGQGNDTAIAALVELIGSSQSDYTRRQAAESLEKIGQGNDTAIAALVELIGSSQSDYTRRQAAESLEKIGQGNDTAIAALVELIGTSQSEDTLRQVVKSLGIIGRGNDKAIAALMELIGNFQSKYTLRWAVKSLGEIVREPQMPKLVSALKDYLSDETYKNDPRLFNECYTIIRKCAQTLPYPIFHQAWHNLPTSPPVTQTLEQQLTNIRTQHQHIPLLCIDAEILETETTETAIAQTLCELISTTALPEADYPEVNDAPQLRKHLRALAKQQGRSGLVILMHNCGPQPKIQQFCRKIANIAHIAWITETPLEPPLRGFAPSQEDLAGAIASWLQELGIDG
ncbi:MAG: HEAT repeat domain-containing protein [Hormoscilla sp. GUM202]|nr:HEAT repeat domain-containing protein [Hormoscilla sp. GUM202]